MLHGYGSDEDEPFRRLMPLLSPELVVASARGPIAESSGFAWVSMQTSLTTLSEAAVAVVANDIAQTVIDWLDSLSGFRSIGLAATCTAPSAGSRSTAP